MFIQYINCLFSFLLSIVSDVPVMDDTLTRIPVVGLSPELPVVAFQSLKFVETVVQRAANVKTGEFVTLASL